MIPTKIKEQIKSDKNKGKVCWIDGEYVKWDNAVVHIKTHALSYGSSIIEGIRAYKVEEGYSIFRLDDHIERFYKSAKIYDFQPEYSPEEIKNAIIELVRKNASGEDLYIRPIMFIGYGPLGLYHKKNPVDVAIYVVPLGRFFGEEAIKKGITVKISSWRRIPPDIIPPEAKMGGNYLNSIMAKLEAKNCGFDDAILLTREGFLSEATGANVFIVHKNTLITPPTSASILPGITRETIIQLAKDEGYPVIERMISRGEIYRADEIFFCGTADEVTPVSKVDHVFLGVGPVTMKIRDLYMRTVRCKNMKYKHWCTLVKI